MILINREVIINKTGVEWRDFHWELLDGSEAWFDVAASGFPTTVMPDKLFSGFLDPPTNNKAKKLGAAGGVIPSDGPLWIVGDTAPLKIGIDLSSADPVSITFKQRPTRDGKLGGGACCIGLDCFVLTQADCDHSQGIFHGVETVCEADTCLPDNDECGDCVTVFTGVAHNGSTEGATGTDITSCAFNDTIDVWHCWKADCTGTATFSLCGSSFDTTLAVFSACGGTQLACNDDFCGLQSQSSLAVTAGTDYYIRVSGYNGATGSYVLNVSCQAPQGGGNNDGPRIRTRVNPVSNP
jgi:hypothetical protein